MQYGIRGANTQVMTIKCKNTQVMTSKCKNSQVQEQSNARTCKTKQAKSMHLHSL